MNIGFDCDGVLAHFSRGFSEIGNKLFGLPLVTEQDVQHWNWHKWYCTKEQENRMWDEVKKTNNFWTRLDCFNSKDLEYVYSLHKTDTVYILTNRMNTGSPIPASALLQTQDWFDINYGFVPSILISSAKGILCNGLKIDYYIDDKFTCCVDVIKSSPKTRVFMMGRKHNRNMPDIFPSYFEKGTREFPEITIVNSVSAFFNEIPKSSDNELIEEEKKNELGGRENN